MQNISALSFANYLVKEVEEWVGSTTERLYRPQLDKKYHIVDLSYNLLKSGKMSKSTLNVFDDMYPALIDAIKKEVKHIYPLSSFNTNAPSKLPPIFILEDTSTSLFLVGTSYSNVQSVIRYATKSRTFKEYWSTDFGSYKNTGATSIFDRTTRTNIGHIAADGNTTPAKEKILALEKILVDFGPTTSALAKGMIDKAITDLHKVHSTISVNLHNTLSSEQFNTGTLGSIFKGSVVVTIQTHAQNSQLAILEKQIIDKLTKEVEQKIITRAMNITSSPSALEDIEAAVVDTITSGKVSTVKKHNKVTRTASKTTSVKSNSLQKTITLDAQSRTRVGGKFYSLSSLQSIINAKLHDAVRANMGTGSATKVLNYRTGRFASSASIERMSVSKEGMITAFYTYMKYPYQTFEPGYAQGIPESRSPRLLISKSIRDIATTIVSNRMRAVLI